MDDTAYPFPIKRYERDQDLMDKVKHTRRPQFKLYRPNEVEVVLGRGSDPEVELHTDRIVEDQVPVYRRPGGGCAVVLDEGNVVVAVALPAPGLSQTKQWYDRCTSWMIDGLERAGVTGTRKAGISDLAIGDRKIAGSAVYRAKDIFYYAVTLLITPRLELIDRYLPHPPREPDYRNGRSHRDFVVSLSEAVNVIDREAFMEKLRHVLDLGKLGGDDDWN